MKFADATIRFRECALQVALPEIQPSRLVNLFRRMSPMPFTSGDRERQPTKEKYSYGQVVPLIRVCAVVVVPPSGEPSVRPSMVSVLVPGSAKTSANAMEPK